MPDGTNPVLKLYTDPLAQKYYGLFFPAERRYFFSALQRMVEGRTILDVGTGNGVMALAMAPRAQQVVALDRCDEFLAIGKKRASDLGLEKVDFVSSDMRSFELGRRFDLVTCCGAALQDILTLEGQLLALRAMRRHLAPQGTLFLEMSFLHAHMLNCDSLHTLEDDRNPSRMHRCRTCFEVDLVPGIITGFMHFSTEEGGVSVEEVKVEIKHSLPSEREIQAMLAASGFRVVRYVESPGGFRRAYHCEADA